MQTRTARWALVAVMLTTASVAVRAQIRQSNASYGRLPLTFEANHGQTNPEVKFLSRGNGYTAFLTAGGLSLSLRRQSVPIEDLAELGAGKSPQASSTLRLRLLGTVPNPEVIGQNLQPGIVNYFIGNDPAKWQTEVPTYGKVRYKNVYPGIDLVYYGNHRQLEYDFEILPGSDPACIQFEIEGASQVAMDRSGNLVLQTANGSLLFQSPVVYQETDGQRVPIDGEFVTRDSTHVGFRIGHYDLTKPLVIDPVLVYSTYLGGSGIDQITGIAVDSAGSAYVVGYTDSANFPLATLGSLPTNTYHVFVTKLDASGSNLVYADYLGGSSQDYGTALVLDSANNVYVTGSTASNNFPTVKPYQAQQPGPYSGFLTKVSANGSSLLYSTYLGGNTFDQPMSIAIDGLGQAVVAGSTMSQNFPMANAYQPTAAANQGGIYGNYGFLTKFSADGSSLVYSTYLAGNSNVVQDCGTPCWPAPYNAISAVTVDPNGNTYVTGTTNTYNFPVTTGAYLTSNSAPQDAAIGFVSKLSSTGGLDYSSYFYGSSGAPVGIAAIAVDSTGSAYIAGNADSDGTFPITSTGICDPSVVGVGCGYAFVTKFDPTASTLLYSTFLGPNNFAAPQALALDAAGDAYVLSSTSSSSFLTNNAIEAYTSKLDLLLVELDPAATTQLFATYLGGSGNDSPGGMALDAAAGIYIAGFTDSTDFPTSPGAFQSLSGGNTDGFISKVGAGSGPSVFVSPSTLQYSSLPVGFTSQPQPVLLRNMSNAALSISSISATGDFAESDICGNSVSAAGSCTLSVTFTPTTPGTRTGAILITDDAPGSPHIVNLSGSGLGPAAALTPSNLVFQPTPVGTFSAVQAVQLTNTGTMVLNVSSVQVAGDFAQTNNCVGNLAAGSSCTFNVTFVPTSSGSRSGTLTISDNATGSPQVVGLAGTGSDFSLASSPGSANIKAGANATYSLTVASLGGSFASAITLSCGGAPALTTCSVSPSSVTPGSGAITSTLTVTTTAPSAAMAAPFPTKNQPIYAACLPFLGFGFLGIFVFDSRRWRKKVAPPTLLTVIAGMLLLMSACVGGTAFVPQNQPGTTPGTYTITATGASGTLQHSVQVMLTVQ